MSERREFHMERERKLVRKKWREEKVMKILNKGTMESRKVSGNTNVGMKKIKSDEKIEVPHLRFKQRSTLSIAVPGSILENAQSSELRTYLAGQIARAACIFKIDEVVVFDDLGEEVVSSYEENYVGGLKETKHCCAQLARILQYLECPQYLRKQLFPLHKDLQFAGILNPLDAPHHFRQNDVSLYREGVVARRPVKHGCGSLVNVGLGKDVVVDHVLHPGTRVTVKLEEDCAAEGASEGIHGRLRGQVVPPWQPKAHLGTYWGYQVRLASCLRAALSQCPFSGRHYDLTIGTSDKGTLDIPSQLPPARHIMILFGGVRGLEAALENNGGLLEKKVAGDASLLFDYYFNTCPGQGSRTIRTEEALLISLSVLMPKILLSEYA